MDCTNDIIVILTENGAGDLSCQTTIITFLLGNRGVVAGSLVRSESPDIIILINQY